MNPIDLTQNQRPKLTRYLELQNTCFLVCEQTRDLHIRVGTISRLVGPTPAF